MNWTSSFKQLSEEYETAMIAIAINAFCQRQFDQAIDFGMIFDMMLMGGEMAR